MVGGRQRSANLQKSLIAQGFPHYGVYVGDGG